MKLISVKNLKDFLGSEVGSGQDPLLTTFIEGVSKRFETFTGRLFEQIERTEYFRGGRKNFFVESYPIDSGQTVTVVIEDVTKVENTDYWVDHARGVIEFEDQIAKGDPKSVAITYTGGYAAASGVLGVPDDMKLACKMQTAFAFRRKRTLGVKGVNMPDGTMTINEPDALLNEVKEILKSYKRMII